MLIAEEAGAATDPKERKRLSEEAAQTDGYRLVNRRSTFECSNRS
jgi:hypothetical protein